MDKVTSNGDETFTHEIDLNDFMVWQEARERPIVLKCQYIGEQRKMSMRNDISVEAPLFPIVGANPLFAELSEKLSTFGDLVHTAKILKFLGKNATGDRPKFYGLHRL